MYTFMFDPPPSPVVGLGRLADQGATPRAGWAARTGAALWRGLEAVDRARAHPQLMAFADRCEPSQAALARELRAAARQGPLS